MSNTQHSLVAGSAYLFRTVQFSYTSIHNTAVDRSECMQPLQEQLILVWKPTQNPCCPRTAVKRISKSSNKLQNTTRCYLRETITNHIKIKIYGIYVALYPDAQSALQHFVGDFSRLLIQTFTILLEIHCTQVLPEQNKQQIITLGTMPPTLFEQCVGSVMSHTSTARLGLRFIILI